MKKFFLLAICFFISSCSNISFNQRFANAGWDKVIITPFTGEYSEVAEMTFEHELAITSKLNVISASMTKSLLKENALFDLYIKEPEKAIFMLANKISANGVIFAKIESKVPKASRSADIVITSASIYAKLIDVETRSIVASSHQESDSMFSGIDSLVRDISLNSVDEFEKVFDLLASK